jgi:hypothetical protein
VYGFQKRFRETIEIRLPIEILERMRARSTAHAV